MRVIYKLCAPSHMPYCNAPLPSGCSGVVSFYNKPVIWQIEYFHEFCEPLSQIIKPGVGEWGNPLLIAIDQKHR